MKPKDLMGVRSILAAAAGGLLLGTAGLALADATDEPLATLYVGTDEVWWDPKPQLKNKSAVLTVSAPNGDVTSETFSAGDQPFYPVGEDGTYVYEMYGMSKGRMAAQGAMPEGSPGAIDANGRPSNSNAANPPQARRGTVQSGSFSVAGGVPVDPSQQED
jgi:hypothetical protein